jgi:hypothetical protein
VPTPRAVVKLEEAANRVELSLLSAAAVMPPAQSFNRAVVETWCGRSRK